MAKVLGGYGPEMYQHKGSSNLLARLFGLTYSTEGITVMEWLKRKWVSVVLAGVAGVCGVDVLAGLKAGKSLVNITMLPSLTLGPTSLVALAVKWLNGRTVVTRPVSGGLDAETLQFVEAVYEVASSPDLTDEQVEQLASMAASGVKKYAVKNRPVAPVVPPADVKFPAEFAEKTAEIRASLDVPKTPAKKRKA